MQENDLTLADLIELDAKFAATRDAALATLAGLTSNKDDATV